MVGIDTHQSFTLLRIIDQFALCGISPDTKLTFDELRKPDALRLCYTSFPDTKEDKERAVIRFYANKKNHQGLTWQPYLRDAKGALLAWNDPAIWEAPVAKGRTPPPSPRKKNGQAAPKKEKPKKEKPKKEKLKKEKTKAKAETSSSQQASKQSQKTNNAVPERKPSPYSGKPSTQERSSWLQSSQGPVPEKSKNPYAAMPGSREEFKRPSRPERRTPAYSSTTPPKRRAKPERREKPAYDDVHMK